MDGGDVASAGVSRDLLQQLLAAGLDMPTLHAMLAALEGPAATSTATWPLEPHAPQAPADNSTQLLSAAGAAAAADHTTCGINGSAAPAMGRAGLSHSLSLDGRSALPPVSPQVSARSRPQPMRASAPCRCWGPPRTARSPACAPGADCPTSRARSPTRARWRLSPRRHYWRQPPLQHGQARGGSGRDGRCSAVAAVPRAEEPPIRRVPQPRGQPRSVRHRRQPHRARQRHGAAASALAAHHPAWGGCASAAGGSARRRGGGVRAADSGGRGSHSRGSSGEQGYEVGSSSLGAGEGGRHDGAGTNGHDGDGEAGGAHREEGGRGRGRHSTKPRSVAERMRRERISARLKRLKDVMPRTDARTDTAAMLDDAVVYIRSLQMRCAALERQNSVLAKQVADVARARGHSPQ
ncbi:hypothetical protein CLOM_g18365 [Closterium sp. NIES-68]|nr:hypothetical protein CLOM_g18365 [Closterium sp. NIES-68]